MKKIPISVLDLAPIRQDKSIRDSFLSSLELAQHVEALGYRRVWMAEHHNLEGVASAATSVLLGFIAGGTRSIRIGSGGVMLPNHSPLVIAEQFGTLESLYPGRIDLGLGRAPGTDMSTLRALRRNTEREADFGELVQELQFLLDDPEEGQRLRAIPGAGLKIPLWILGSSLYSAHLAAALGLPYAFAGHFAPDQMLEAIAIYRKEFRASATLDQPYVMIGAQAIAADTDAEAQHLATTLYQRFLGMIRNTRGPLPRPVPDMDALWDPREREAILHRLRFSVIGGRETFARGLAALIERTRADELILNCEPYDNAARLKSFSLIAEIAQLKPLRAATSAQAL